MDLGGSSSGIYKLNIRLPSNAVKNIYYDSNIRKHLFGAKAVVNAVLLAGGDVPMHARQRGSKHSAYIACTAHQLISSKF